LRQVTEHILQDATELLAIDDIRGDFTALDVDDFCDHRSLACDGERRVHANARRPRGELRVAAELRQVAIDLEPRLLHDIFRFVIASHDRARRTKQALIVTPYELFELFTRARNNSFDEDLVRQHI
jgi:hypothetical protein